jgi:ferritin-like metal-binding protein YciE
LFIENLQDLLHAEMQLVEALPKMAEAAHHPKLKEAFQRHLTQTEGQVERLKKVFEVLGRARNLPPSKRAPAAMEIARAQPPNQRLSRNRASVVTKVGWREERYGLVGS